MKSIHELITAPWDERDMEAVAKAWPEVQRFYGLDDLPEETEYAGMGSASIESPSFNGYVARPPEQWQCKTTWWGTAVDFHYARVIEKETNQRSKHNDAYIMAATAMLNFEVEQLKVKMRKYDTAPAWKQLEWWEELGAKWEPVLGQDAIKDAMDGKWW